MRGKVSVKLDTLATAGITPAYAGKSLERVPHTPSCQDHPRLCGEKCRHRWRKGSSTGSPPPMRGKAAADTYHPHYHGITPAYAGKSSFLISAIVIFLGSPPPMRGKDDEATATKDKVGITPAYAGKSVQSASNALVPRDHPRLCGEKGKFVKNMMLNEGSPPPMRGKAASTCPRLADTWITPAYAGKS